MNNLQYNIVVIIIITIIIIKTCHDFLLHQGGVVMSSDYARIISPNIHPIALILGTCAFNSVVCPFLMFISTTLYFDLNLTF